MNLNDLDPKNLPQPVKFMLVHLALCGWEALPGDAFSTATVAENVMREVFGEDACIKRGRLIVTGPTARDFMALYRRAAAMPLLQA
jgi:hypothetical protein